MGEILKVELNKLKQKHPSVGDARAIGLFSLVELVKDRTTREPLVPYNPKPSELGPIPAFNAFLRENGLFTFVRWNTCFVNPPLMHHRAAAARRAGDHRPRAGDRGSGGRLMWGLRMQN